MQHREERIIVVEEKRRPSVLELHQAVLAELEDAKGEDIVSIDLAGKSDIADYMVIASGRSDRQIGAMADRLMRRFKAIGMGSVPVEGLKAGDWVLIDGGDVIVHLFHPEIRTLYNLEKMWAITLPTKGAESVGLSSGAGR